MWKRIQLILLLFVLMAALTGCKSSDLSTQPVNVPLPTTEVQAVQDLGNGIYMKVVGWELPLSVPMKLGDTGTDQFNDSKGRPIKCTYSFLIPQSEFITRPFEELGPPYHDVRIDSVTKVEVNGKVYKYEVHGGEGEKDGKTGRFVQQGPSIIYSYVDRDADGVFETLDTGSLGTAFSSWIDDLN